MIGDLRLCDLCAEANSAWQNGTRGSYDAGDCHIYRTDEDGYTVLAAAGSERFKDWIVDLMAGWKADASAVLPLLPRFDLPLILTGHSKGGADIVDLADKLWMAGGGFVRLVAYEGPATGVPKSAAFQVTPTTLWAHHGDGVPLLPLGIAHAVPLTWFTAPALPEIPDLFANHHLATAIRPALIAMGITS